MSELQGFPYRSDYGDGVFRRRIRLLASTDKMLALLDDDCHAIWVELRHDAERITHAHGGFDRWPTTECPRAGVAIGALMGTTLSTSLRTLYRGGMPQRNCTHMFDLAVLAMRMWQQGERARTWDVSVPDARTVRDPDVTATVALDGRQIHQWALRSLVVASPDHLSGGNLAKGYLTWIEDRFAGIELDAALVLRMGVFVARARRHVVDGRETPLSDFPHSRGVCHAYSTPQFERAVQRAGTVRDFTRGVIEQPWPPAAAS